MRVTFYQRKPYLKNNFSIERVFDDIRKALPNNIKYKIAISSYDSRGIWARVYNIIEAAFHQGDVNHITGDVHFLAFLFKKRRTVLSIMDCGNLEELKGFNKFLFFLFWFWIPEKRVSLISVISDATKKELLRYLNCNPDKIKVIYCPVSDIFKPAPKVFNIKKPALLQIGVTKNKNIERLAEALKGVHCHLRIIGKLSQEQISVLKAYNIDYLAVANISDMELVEQYQQSDMVVFVSTYEGFGLPIIEANAMGRPVVTSNILSMPEVAGDAACLVNPFDVSSIRAGILSVIQDESYREKLIKNGFKNVERFRPHAIAYQYVELYKELFRNSSNYKDFN